MKNIIPFIAGAMLAMGATTAQALDREFLDDFGWGGRYNQHLSEYDGRPLGPPLPALPPCSQYYNGRIIRVPCYYGAYPYGSYYDPAQVGSIRPRHVVKTPRAARAHRRH